MIRFLTLAMCATLLGCGGDASKEKPKVVVAPTEKKEAKKEEAKKVERKLVEVDLTPYAFRGSMQLPATAEISIEDDHERHSHAIVRFGEKQFWINGLEPSAALPTLRRAFVERDQRATLLIDEPNSVLMRRTDRTDFPLAMVHFAPTEVGTLRFEMEGEAADESILRETLSFWKTYRYPDRMKSQDAQLQLVLDDLGKKQVEVFDRAGNHFSVVVGPKSQITGDDLKRLSVGGEMISLQFEGPGQLKPEAVQALLKETVVENLWLRGPEFTDEWLACLDGAKGVRQLDLVRTSMTGKGMARLANLPLLTSFSVLDTKVGDDFTAILVSLERLERLNLGGTRITDTGLASLRDLNRLKQLSLESTRITDTGLTHLANLSQLHRLDLRQTRVNGSGFAYLRGMKQLRRLNLDGTDTDDRGLERLKGFGLRRLNLSGTAITDGGLKPIGELKSLRELDLSSTSVSDTGMVHLKTLTGLQLLDLRECRIRGGGLNHLIESKQLHTLNLSGNPIDESQFPDGSLFTVGNLRMESTPITNASLSKLKSFAGRIDIESTSIDAKAVADLGKTPATFHGAKPEVAKSTGPPTAPKPTSEFPAANPQALFDKLKRQPTTDENDPNKPIVSVDFSGTPVTDLELAELRDLKTLKSLNLSNTKLTGSGLPYVSGLVALQELNLAGTSIPSSAFVYLKPLTKLEKVELPDVPATAKELEPLGALTNLSLVNRPPSTRESDWLKVATKWPNLSVMTARENQHLESIAKMTALKRVRVEDPISNAGLFFLKPLKELRHLELNSKSLSDPGLVNVNGLHELVELRIPHAPIGDSGMSQIKGAYKLTQLTIGNGYALTDRGAADLRDLPELAELFVREPKFSDKGFEMLCELKHLEHLQLPGCVKLTDAIWQHVKKVEELRSLDVSGSQVTGKGIDVISELTRLRSLNFANTQLTDDALTYLRRLPGLMELNLSGTKVTDAAVKEFQTARPMVKIVR